MNQIVLLTPAYTAGISISNGYLAGAIIALFILGYLLYSLVKPEKF